LLVIVMAEANDEIRNLFTRGSHHRNLSIFFLTQNLYHKGSYTREMNINANYLIIFKNPRDQRQISYLSSQMYPNDPKFLQEAYRLATEKAHSYLMLDLRQSTPEALRVRTDILNEQSPTFFVSDKLSY